MNNINTWQSSTHQQRQPTAGFMTHITCRLTAKNRDQLRNPMLGNRLGATFTFCTRSLTEGMKE